MYFLRETKVPEEETAVASTSRESSVAVGPPQSSCISITSGLSSSTIETIADTELPGPSTSRSDASAEYVPVQREGEPPAKKTKTRSRQLRLYGISPRNFQKLMKLKPTDT